MSTQIKDSAADFVFWPFKPKITYETLGREKEQNLSIVRKI